MALISTTPARRGNPAWVKGFVANPNGRKQVSTKGIQEPGPRMKLLLAQHGVGKILKAAKDPQFLDKEFSGYDGMLIMALANSLSGNETAIENRLNRMFGKVPDKQVNLNLNIDADPQQLSDRALSMLAQLGADTDDDGSDLIEG